MRAAMVPLREAWSSGRRGCPGRPGPGFGVRSSRWNTPPERHRQVRGDRRHDAARRAGDEHTESDVNGIPPSGWGSPSSPWRERPVQQGDAEAPAVDTADLDTAGVAQRLLEKEVGHRRGPPVDGQVDRLDEAPGRSFLYDLVKPVTAPPSADVAPPGP